MFAGDIDLSHELIWTLDGVLPPDECRAMIARVEAQGTAPAPITTALGFQMRPDIRNNTRLILFDHDFATDLFGRVREHVPARMRNMEAVGANEMLRIYKYEPGQRFAPHYDGYYERNPKERSLLTFMIYLNEGFEGGETEFEDPERSIAPRTGMALFFQHRLLHQGKTVKSGVKYVIRSDIMYRAA